MLIDELVNNRHYYMKLLLGKSRGDQYAAEEAFQISAEKLLSCSFKPDNPKKYVGTVVINSLYNFYKVPISNFTIPNTLTVERLAMNVGYEDKFHTTEEEDMITVIKSTIITLPTQRRKIMEEFIRLDSLSDIKMGLKYNSVKAHYRQACKQIKEKINATN